jgi:hypothetical protein
MTAKDDACVVPVPDKTVDVWDGRWLPAGDYQAFRTDDGQVKIELRPDTLADELEWVAYLENWDSKTGIDVPVTRHIAQGTVTLL